MLTNEENALGPNTEPTADGTPVSDSEETRSESPACDIDETAPETPDTVTPSETDGTQTSDGADHAEQTPAPVRETTGFIRLLFDYVEMFAIALSVVLLMFMFALRLCDVRGESMEQTLFEGEKLFVSNLFYTPERGDIVIFHQTGSVLNEPIVKRVIATGGETVDIEFGEDPMEIVIRIYDKNGNLIEDPLDESDYMYMDTEALFRKADYQFPITVPEGYLFVLGDNRNHSTDSRSRVIGLVDERRVLGRVLFRVTPIDKAGPVD